MIGPYRPHGPLRWLLSQFTPGTKWALVGSLAAEKRSVTVARELKAMNALARCRLLKINDEPSPFAPDVDKAVKERHNEFRRVLAKSFEVSDIELMSDVAEIEPLYAQLEPELSESVILDISCLPKRFFFYFLRRMIGSVTVRNLLVTITVPGTYGKELSRNAGSWDFLPSFGREQSGAAQPLLVIAIGYQDLSLVDIVAESDPRAVRLLFPFPSKPPGSIRNWQVVRNIIRQEKVRLQPSDIMRVHPQDVSLAFDIVNGQCSDLFEEVWLAPFGPKATSLAMALFALAREEHGAPVSVGYNQPPAYSATYSIGVERAIDGNPRVHAYCVKCDGMNFYSI